MNTEKIREDVFVNDYGNSPEEVANRYSIRCATSAIAVVFVIWIFNRLDIFTVDQYTTSICFFGSLGAYLVGLMVCIKSDLSKSWVKYFILLWLDIIITIMTASMSYHSLIACLLPIICSSMYCSKKVSLYTYVITVISVFVTVFVGYYYGICDANMVLLTGDPLSEYIGYNNKFLLRDINNDVIYTLTLFFALPRCMIITGFSIVCYRISRIINLNYRYAKKMENRAEIDGMTSLYNRSKYLDTISDSCTDDSSVAVIFWDINLLKSINDNLGHEAGDKLILSVANSIKAVTGHKDMSYRIGGDEFVMIMRNCDEKMVKKKISEWQNSLEEMRKIADFPISVSVGYAVGKGKNISDVVRKADEMMYENKRKSHNERENFS